MRDALAEMLFAAHTCEVDGCENVAPSGRYCRRCDEEITAVREMARRELARMRAAAARRRAGGRLDVQSVWAAVSNRIWIVNLLLVFGVLVLFGFVWMDAVLAWIRAGGWNQ